MKRFWLLFLLLPLLGGCHKPAPEENQLDEQTLWTRYYVNNFGFNVMNTYYLWSDEIAEALKAWATDADPIEKVKEIRYKDATGADIDRWTMITDDYESLIGNIEGVYKTVGMDFVLYYADASRTNVVGVVNYTYAGSPAEQAGLKRGDVFSKVNGSEMTPDNYTALLMGTVYGNEPFQLTLRDGKTMTLTPVVMEEDSVNEVQVLESGGKKVGYLHYTSFTLLSLRGLMDAFADFKAQGIDDLVLDLRYNGGGYVKTCTILASMIAPLDAVNAGAVFLRDVYNSRLTEAWGDDPTCFEADFGDVTVADGVKVKCPAALNNSDLKRLYVLVGTGSASASEGLICGLKPYMDVTVIGLQTHGKYCGGITYAATEWYDSVKKQLEEGVYDAAQPYIGNWGIYVMFSRYADCNGVTLSMPDGIKPDVELDDAPLDGFQLGDPRETMLSAALALIGGASPDQVTASSASTRAAVRDLAIPTPDDLRRPGFGILVNEPPRF